MQRLHTQTEGAFGSASAKDSHITLHMASSVGGGFSNERVLNVDGASPEASRGLFEDHFRFIAADASDRDPFEAQKEDHLRQSAQGPLRSAECPLSLTEGLLRRGDGAMHMTKRVLPPNERSGSKTHSEADGSSLQKAEKWLYRVSLGEHAYGGPLRST